MRSRYVVVLAPLLALAPSRPAEACSPPVCWPGAFVPSPGKEVPANAPGFYWSPIRELAEPDPGGDPSQVVLASEAAPGTPIAFTAQPLGNGDFLIVPDEPLAAGAYLLTDASACSHPAFGVGPSSTFVVGPAAPLPSELGALALAAPQRAALDVATASGSCSASLDAAYVDVELVPAAGAAPWLGVLHFRTVVDGRPWSPRTSVNGGATPGASWRGRGRDRVFAACGDVDPLADAGLAPGAHVVTIEARLPGTTLVLASSSITVELACDPPVDEDEDDGDGDGGGCAATSHAASWPLLVLAAIALRRGRRRVTAPRT